MRGERFTIYRCPNCGKRKAGAYFCRCVIPSSRCQAVEVVEAADLLSLEERLDKLRAAVELECDGLAEVAARFDWANDRACIAASEARLLAAARAAALPGQEEQ